MPSSLPIAALRSLFRHLSANEPMADEHREILAGRLAVFLATPDGSLDKVLGLRRWGGISQTRADIIDRRNRLLVRLWHEHEDFRGHPPIVAAKLMHLSATRYQATRWPREQDALSAPLSEPSATWWRALRLGAGIPQSKRLQQILQWEIQDDV